MGRMKRVVFFTGFTLIELLVVVVISIILLGGGLVAFSNFGEKRAVINAVDELKTYFQLAQTKTSAGDLGGCEQLNGYKVQTYLVGTTTEISLQAVCGVGTASSAQTFSLPANVTVSPNIDITFQVLNAGVTLPGGTASQDIIVANDENSYLFTLYREGRVSEGVWQ